MTDSDLAALGDPRASHPALEVIVTSLEEALAAEAGGADRLELVQSLALGGLTPPPDLVRRIVDSVRIPVRVMVRSSDSMQLAAPDELECLTHAATQIAAAGASGLVFGYVQQGRVDESALRALTSACPNLPITFHRAFEHVESPSAALEILANYPQIDRVLVRVCSQPPGFTPRDLSSWSPSADGSLRFIAGIGLNRMLLALIPSQLPAADVHVGRLARDPETNFGSLSTLKVASLKSALA